MFSLMIYLLYRSYNQTSLCRKGILYTHLSMMKGRVSCKGTLYTLHNRQVREFLYIFRDIVLHYIVLLRSPQEREN